MTLQTSKFGCSRSAHLADQTSQFCIAVSAKLLAALRLQRPTALLQNSPIRKYSYSSRLTFGFKELGGDFDSDSYRSGGAFF